MAPPTKFSQQLADTICERLIEGRSLRSICHDKDMPEARTVHRWLATNEAFSQQYGRAREAQADTLVDQILDIADTPETGTKTKVTPNGTETTTGDMIEHRRLQVDARKWMAGKLAPKKYGDKITQEHTGVDGKPIETVTRIELVAPGHDSGKD